MPEQANQRDPNWINGLQRHIPALNIVTWLADEKKMATPTRIVEKGLSFQDSVSER